MTAPFPEVVPFCHDPSSNPAVVFLFSSFHATTNAPKCNGPRARLLLPQHRWSIWIKHQPCAFSSDSTFGASERRRDGREIQDLDLGSAPRHTSHHIPHRPFLPPPDHNLLWRSRMPPYLHPIFFSNSQDPIQPDRLPQPQLEPHATILSHPAYSDLFLPVPEASHKTNNTSVALFQFLCQPSYDSVISTTASPRQDHGQTWLQPRLMGEVSRWRTRASAWSWWACQPGAKAILRKRVNTSAFLYFPGSNLNPHRPVPSRPGPPSCHPTYV